MKEYEKHLKSNLDVYKTTTFRTFSSAGLNIPQTQLEYLGAKGLITIVPRDANSFDYRITVKDEALTYFDNKINHIKKILTESVLLPIFVTLITNLLVILLKQLL